MLSRVAENIYWMGRYMERAENTARLINVTTNLLLDMPRWLPELGEGWDRLISITGSHQSFQGREPTEENVVGFLVDCRDYPGSVISCLHQARENMRTTREIFPREAWEYLNDLYLRAREDVGRSLGAAERHPFLTEVIEGSQKVTGLLHGAMSRDEAFEFFLLGQNLERADMTTRILDVRAASLSNSAGRTLLPYENSQWLAVLRSVSGLQMYRRHVISRISGTDVLRFLLMDRRFPRAFLRCLYAADASLARLPRNAAVREMVYQVAAMVESAPLDRLLQTGLREFLDQLQVELGEMHLRLVESYFQTSLTAKRGG
ncbi:MAG: alpha-E domain-containing protein [Magnetococcales bacterium]|nr:alpha-E domain-containing protein [Magnetococcales bacterium]